jgi:hypothetical protein
MPVVNYINGSSFRCGASGSAEVLKINIRMAEEQTEFMFQDIKMSETIKET